MDIKDKFKNKLNMKATELGYSVSFIAEQLQVSRSTAWKTALQGAGITRRIRPYDLRHQMITRALEAGADIKALSEVVGSSPETLRKHYQHAHKKENPC
jgi:site-specific recombinase XerD